jgi:hypothetical protein
MAQNLMSLLSTTFELLLRPLELLEKIIANALFHPDLTLS